MFRTAPSPALLLRTVPLVAVTALLLAGCGSGGSGSAASGSAPESGSWSSGHGRPTGFGGVDGPIASVATGSFTVTASAGATTVDYGTSTVFTRTAAGTLADVRTGTCVAIGETSGSDASTGSVDASSVRISAPVKGSCVADATAGAFGGGGFGGFGRGGGRHSGAADGGSGAAPSGAPDRGGFARRSLVAGTVASTSATGFVVTVDASAGGAGGTVASGTTTAVTVSTSTVYTVTSTATAKDLAVGECARVFSGFGARASGAAGRSSAGASAAPSPASPTGPVSAMAVTLSPPANGTCTGFGSQGGPGGSAGASGAGA